MFMNLDSHVDTKVEPAKTDHSTLPFHRQNIPACAALLTLANHVVDDIPGSDYLTCLLKNPFGEFTRVEGNLRDAEGCYLYYDKKNGKWVRSGKVAGSESSPKGMWQRNKEHSDEAKRGGTASALYTSFPSKDSDRAKSAREMNIRPYPWSAYFEELIQFCGVWFKRGGSVDVHLMSNYEKDCSQKGSKGLFVWSENTIDSLNSRRGQTSLKDMQLHMVAYILELSYDLLLAPGNNVSTQPGYEKFGLINTRRML